MSDEIKKEEGEDKATPKKSSNSQKKSMKIADKKCTAKEYAGLTGLGKRLRFWLNKKYDSKEVRTAQEWTDELLKEKAIDKAPEILTKVVKASK